MPTTIITLRPRPLILALLLASSYQPITAADSQQILDWVPLKALSEQQRKALPLGSCGAYIAPERNDNDAKLEPESAPLRASADRTSLIDRAGNQQNANKKNSEQKQVILIGDVHITQGYRQLKAQRAELDQGQNSLVLEGELELREPGLLVLGDRAKIVQQPADNKQSSLNIDGATYLLHQQGIRGSAEQINKGSDQRIRLQQASYTQCEPGNNTWLLKGSQIILDTDKRQGHAKHVRLLVKGVPVFYFPYLRFPLGDARLSGFLAPSFSYSDSEFGISVPYYFNLAPNYDALLTTHWLEAHGALFEGQFRHLHRYFESELNLGYLHKDKGKVDDDEQALINAGSLSEAAAVPFKDEDRWVVNLNQQGGRGQKWSTLIDYTDVSDRDYFEDFGNQTAATRSDDYLNQVISSAYQGQHWQFGLSATRFELLEQNITIPYEQIPAITANGLYDFAETGSSRFTLALNNEWIDFDHENAEGNNPILTGQRLRSDYSFGWNLEPQWGFFRPRVQVKHLQYRFDDNNFVSGADQSPSLTVPQAIIDGGLFFERDGNAFGHGYLQTFEPRLFYFYSDFEDHSVLFDLTTDGQDVDFDTTELSFDYNQLFRDTRFAGKDRIDDANQLAIGLTTRFYGNDSGREWFNASIGQIRFFEDRRVTLNNNPQQANSSAIALQMTARPSDEWTLKTDLLYNEQSHEIDRGNASLRFQNRYKQLFDLGYRFTRGATDAATIEQLDASVIAPLFDPRWHLILYSAYDTVRNRELDTLGAIQYKGCCYRLRLGYRSELDSDLSNLSNSEIYDDTVFFELHFTGLGGTSKQLDNLFEEEIEGYSEWQSSY